VELLRAHDAIIRRCLERHGGAEVKHLGDGIMASFVDVPASAACALRIQEEFATYNAGSETPIRVRIGIHAGEPVEESDDLFGSAVQLTARICDAAPAGTILVSDAVREACAGAGLVFEPVGAKTLKGFAAPVPLFSPA